VKKVPWSIDARIRILKKDGWLPPGPAREMRKFNRIRNRLLHWTPGTPVDEIGRTTNSRRP
jgi:uncharacterized protein YutE (UPF0331/DUF86 family)